MNIISKDNLKNTSQSFLRNFIQSTSEMNGCPITNILDKEQKSIWLSEESLPQEILLHINKSYFKYFPKKISTIGIYCWHAYSTNPKLLEILLSVNSTKNYISLGNFDLGLKPGMQLLQLDEDLLLENDSKLNEDIYIKIIIKETFGGKRTYINNLSLYENIDFTKINLKSIKEVNAEEDNSVVYLRESRSKNNLKKNKNNNGNILLTSEILISDSDLSDRKIFGDKVDKFFGINSNKNENKNNQNKINYGKNIIKGKTTKKEKEKENTPIKQDKNVLVSDKKSLLNSNIFAGNNNIINTQTSQNNFNNNLLTTEMMQNDFFTPEKQNKFCNSKGEISNIEFIGENQPLINEFRSYQKSQEEKQKKFEERIINIENKINEINSQIIDITNNLSDLINKEKIKEKEIKKEKEKEKELILKQCEQMIKLTLIEILEKKLNFDEEKKATKKTTRIKNKVKQNDYKNYNSNKIPESKLNKYNENFYQTYYNINNNQNTIDYSYNQNITLDPNNNYMTHKIPFYNKINNSINNNSNNNNSNNNVIFNHKRNSTFSLNYLNNKNNLEINNNINNSQNIKFETKFNISSNNYSQISDNFIRDKINNSQRTPMNISNFKIPHNNTHHTQNLKGSMRDSIQSKEQTIKLKKNKSNFSNLSYKKNNTINNSHQNSHKLLITKRQHSHTDLRNRNDIANKINNHLEEKFADIGDKIGKNINESLLKPSLAKIKKIMKKNMKQVKNSLKKAELNQRSVRNNNNYSYNS